MTDQEFSKLMEQVPLEEFDKIIPRRRAMIEKASDEFAPYEFHDNILARNLHPHVQHVVVSEIVERPGAKSFTLVPDKEKGTEKLAYFKAGQYVSVSLNIGHSVLTRAYTLSCTPKDALNGSYTLTVKRAADGFASNYINDSWTVGTKLDISGPEGDLNYEPLRDARNIVGLAGGSGITPFFALANAIADGTEDCKLTLLYGCRKEDEIIYRSELDELDAKCENFKVVYVLSDEEKEGFEHGFLNAEVIKKYAPAEDFSVFMCGPQAMYKFADKEVEKLGLSRRRVRHEAYGEYHNADQDDGFPKEAIGKTFNLTVELPGETKVIPAKSGESILVALERAGIQAPSKCRSGECGFCRARLGSGTFYVPQIIEHRRMADVKDGYIHPCCSFPTSDCRIFINCDKGERKLEPKNMAQKQKKVGFIMSAIMSAVMGIIMTTVVRSQNPQAAQTPAAIAYITAIIESVCIGLLATLIIPLSKLGQALVKKYNARPGSTKFTLLNSLPMSIGNGLIVSAAICLINIAQARSHMPPQALAQMPPLFVMWFSSWVKNLPISLPVSYIVSVLISPFVAQAVGLGGPPAGAGGPPQQQ